MKIHDTEKADEYEAEHPIARTHPGTGRKALYVSRSHTIRFRDMSEEESRPLIDFLQAHQIRPEFTCRVRWSPDAHRGTTAAQHCAVNDYHGQRRRMRDRSETRLASLVESSTQRTSSGFSATGKSGRLTTTGSVRCDRARRRAARCRSR